MRWTWIVAALVAAGCGDGSERPECSGASGTACTWAGKPGVFGFNGDGLHRLDTELYWTMDMLFAPDGTPWFIDWNNHLVRKVKPDNTVETVVGWIDPIFPGDGLPGNAERSATGVPGLEVQLNHPTDFAATDDGKILLMAWHNHKLREIDPATGNVRIVLGSGAGFTGDGMAATGALLRQPKALERDAAGNLYILDQANLRVRKIDKATGVITTIAGDGTAGFAGDGGLATAAKLAFETGSNPEPSGGLAVGGSTLYIADTLNHRIRTVDLTTGMIETIAGTGEGGLSGDGGDAKAAQLRHPRDLELGPDGSLYIADVDNHVIRAINLATGVIRTVAGTGELGLDDREDVPATQMTFTRPFGIEFDPDGNLYVSDSINSRIVKVYR